MILLKSKRRVRLGNMGVGRLFMYEDCLAFKTQYSTNGACDCYIYGTGEYFIGAVSDEERDNLLVYPVYTPSTPKL